MADMVKWEPMKDLARLFDEVDKMFAPFFKSMAEELKSFPIPEDKVNLEVHEDGGEIIVTGSIPEALKDNLKVLLHQDKVIISGEAVTIKEHSGGTAYQWSRFTKAFALPTKVKSEKAVVHVQNGQLKIQVPKE